jgi:hypothetical protein
MMASCTAHVAPQLYEITRVPLRMLLQQDSRSFTWLRVYFLSFGCVLNLFRCPHVSAPHLTFLHAAYITGVSPLGKPCLEVHGRVSFRFSI